MGKILTVGNCSICGTPFQSEILQEEWCEKCISEFSEEETASDDEDDYRPTDPNVCSECGADTVQVQNGDWVCPGCDLWLY